MWNAMLKAAYSRLCNQCETSTDQKNGEKGKFQGKEIYLGKEEKVFRTGYTPWNIGLPFAN